MSITLEALDGRLEGLARVLLHLTAALEDQGAIDGSKFADELRRASPRLPTQKHEIAARTMHELARALDEARAYRQSHCDPA